MNNLNLRTITNSFQDVRLVSLASWPAAKEITPCDQGGPYMVTQEGYDPEDPKVIADEFVLGRSGKWLSLGYFFHMPVPDRRAEFIFGTAAEVIEMMDGLPSKAVVFRPGEAPATPPPPPEQDEMVAAYHSGKSQSASTTS